MAAVGGRRLTGEWPAVIALLSLFCTCSAELPTLAQDSHVFNITDSSNTTCISASFDMTFNIYVNASTNNQEPEFMSVSSPNVSQEVKVSGSCDDSLQYLMLSWKDKDYTFILGMNFSTNSTDNTWTLTQVTFMFDPRFFSLYSDLVNAANGSTLVFQTIETAWWNRTFTSEQFFYCKHCKQLPFNTSFPVKNLTCLSNTPCSFAGLENAVIYVGTTSQPTQQQCIEDYLAVRELIVPIVVGGLLLMLLIAVSLAYLIAYVKRRLRDHHTHYHHLDDN